jgi:hypothetical protein
LDKDILPPDINKKLQLFQDVYSDVDAFYASDNNRVASNVAHEIEFTYGEALCIHFLPLLEYVKPKPGEVIWDIGCGSSRPLIVASLFYPELKACKGVEFL